MTAAQELLVNRFMTGTAVAGSEARCYDEPVMVLALLSRLGLMAFEAIHALLAVNAHFVFMDDGILGTVMTFGALSCRSYEARVWLICFDLGPATVDQECPEHERKPDHDCEED